MAVVATVLAALAPMSPAAAVELNQPAGIESVRSFDFDTATAVEVELLFETYVDGEVGVAPFDIGLAMEHGASEDVLTVAGAYNGFLPDAQTSLPNSPSSGALSARVSIPIYGNWCGPGHSGPRAPIDTLDRLCQTHDRCYGSKGYFNKRV